MGFCATRVLALTLAALVAPSALATWSIVIVNKETKEVGVASATCLLNFDLRRFLPVVLVEKGGAAAQSAVDNPIRNRPRIRDGFIAGTDPVQILANLATLDPAHQSRQYGIVDTLGRAVTFTGTGAGAYASGLTGEFGNFVYAIQGNVITGQEVLDDAEAALLDPANVDMPAKLMAAMEAAQCRGGDGRCSCTLGTPDACEFPPDSCAQMPPPFVRSAHIAFMIVSRRGDTDGTCDGLGCARGTYFLNFNIITSVPTTDPVIRLRQLFDPFRAARIGVTDQMASAVQFPSVLPPSASYSRVMQIELRDWQGALITGSPTVTVSSDPRDGTNLIGGPFSATQISPGIYEATIPSVATPGADILAVRVQDAGFDRILLPTRAVRVLAAGDMNGDGFVSVADIGPFVLALTDAPQYAIQFPEIVANIVGDFTGDEFLTVGDISGFVNTLVGG
ncbi:MAG: DUF1028 domain-containing protein [Phycisphaerae bacterium]|nr:DUF1028 domain-containing protein [Phycisphaerae bacterium]